MENKMKIKIKESAKIILLAALFAAPFSAQANWFGGNGNNFFGNNGEWKIGPNGAYWDDSGWPVWTPMYWMDEMMDSFDNNNGWGGNNNWGNNGGYNNMPYGNVAPYGYAAPNYGYAMPYAMPAVPVVPVTPQKAQPKVEKNTFIK